MPYLGETLSLATALVWACAVILLRRSGRSMPPFELNLFRVALTTPLLAATLLVSGGRLVPDQSAQDYLLLILSAVLGVALSDTLFHRALNLLGAGLNSIVACLYAPFVALAALIALDERLRPSQLAGMGLVVTAIVLTSRAVPPPGSTRRNLLAGIAWGTAAMATLALGLVAAKPVLGRAPLLWVATFRQAVSLAVLTLAGLASPRRRQMFSALVPRPDWRFTVPAALLGSYLSLVLWLAGMKYTATGVAAVLNQTSTILVLVLAAVFLGEPFTLRRWAAAALALAGIVLVTVG